MSVTVLVNKGTIKGAREGINQSIQATCAAIAGQAVALCPVDLGQLRNSIMWKTEDNAGGFNDNAKESAPENQKLTLTPKAEEGYVGTNSDHWIIEFGTVKQVAKPFLRPAGEWAKGGSTAAICAKYCREAMEKEMKMRQLTKIAETK